MILSILIPSIPSRFKLVQKLYKHIEGQIKGREVEILVLIDNKKRSIGAKRQSLVDIAKGKYIAFVDDDDNVSGNYIDEMLIGAKKNKDVICFQQLATINDTWSYISFSIENENDEFRPNEITRRKPFHVCGIKRSLTKGAKFPDVGYGEDWHWMEQVLKNVKTEYKTNKVLHFYTYEQSVSEAPTETNEIWKNLDKDYEEDKQG